ncbi:peptidoglycan bridge formation glycyltransferase FemA/FemB family protein [Candidatus Dojkabacteria bacterium]|nr:peptidoglycan bridge formation glycyltransferase FemA/FemB family protein [Candidatus Dojkabacteria bacterium]
MGLEFKTVKHKDEWDQFVQALNRYSFVQSWSYTHVFDTLAERVERIGVYDSNELRALLPLGIIKAKRGNYLKLRHGPILAEKDSQLFSEIVKFFKDLSKEEDLSFVRIHPIIDETSVLEEEGFRHAPTHNLDGEKTLQLELKGRTEKDIKMSMRKNTRYYIRKSFREGVEIVKDNDDFESFYKLFLKTADRQHYTPWPKRYYQKLFDQFKPGERNLFFAEVKGEKVAFGLFIDYGKYRFYKEGGMLMNFSKYYPSYAVQWAAIADAMDKDIEVYDFWGGVSPKDKDGNIIKNYPWAGINLFKAGFGGKEIGMVHPHDLPLDWKYWITWAFESMEKWKRGY